MELIFWGIVIFLIVRHYQNKNSSQHEGVGVHESDDRQTIIHDNDMRWLKFIHSYTKTVKAKSQQELLDRILSDSIVYTSVSEAELKSIYATKPEAMDDVSVPNEVATEDVAMVGGVVGKLAVAGKRDIKASPVKTEQAVKLDNISVLLYFGAFLFVASVGLFVAFSGANGWIRALSVLAVSLIMYCLGQSIYHNRTSLKPAGLAFVGIGVSVAPLVGVAIYGYVDKSNPALIWMLTSLLCIGLYTHAIITLRSSLLDYLFIFTLLSLFESFVSVLSLPVYYFGWVMVAVGLLLQAISLWKNILTDFGVVSRVGGQVYVPLAILVSIATVSNQGLGQLGATLLLASLYYGLAFWTSRLETDRQNSAIASHVSLLVGISSVLYGMVDNLVLVGVVLAVLSVAHLPVIFIKVSDSVIRYNFASIMIGASVASVPLTLGNGVASTIALVVAVLQSLIVWWVQRRSDVYILAGVGWIILPVFIMNLAFPGALSHTWYVVTSVLFLMTHAAFYLVVSLPRCIDSIHMIHVSRVVLLAGIVAAGFVSLIFGSILATVAIGLMVYVLAWRDRQYTWSAVSGLVFAGTLINGWDGESLIWAGIIALATNIILALHFRSDYNRWISTGLWLFMPITVAHALYPNGLETMYYAWMYLVVMLALILSRFIAIGSLLLSTSVPMIVYAKTASISYVVGYVVAGFLAFCLSINSGMDNFGAVAVSSWISLLMLLVARFIEKEPEISVVQPILWQVIAFGFLRSLKVDLRIDIFLGLSTLVAVVIYALADWWRHLYRQSRIVDENTVIFALLTSLITPAYYFVYDITKISMIIGLFVVSGLTYHYWRNRSQGYKEVSITVFTASVMWGMHYFGVREFQAYTHVFAIMLAFFAWMRHELGQVIKSDEYIYGALSVSTVPLAIQAMSSVSGGVYGWVLLLEQVLIMLIGMSIRKRFVLMWGLYVSVGAVLYQLRDLGYAALAVLATFIIGVAVYQLQKYNK